MINRKHVYTAIAVAFIVVTAGLILRTDSDPETYADIKITKCEIEPEGMCTFSYETVRRSSTVCVSGWDTDSGVPRCGGASYQDLGLLESLLSSFGDDPRSSEAFSTDHTSNLVFRVKAGETYRIVPGESLVWVEYDIKGSSPSKHWIKVSADSSEADAIIAKAEGRIPTDT